MKVYEINQYDLADMMAKSAELGGRQALINAGLVSPTISRPQAIRIHTREKIEFLEKTGQLTRIQKGQKAVYHFDVMQLNKALLSEQRNLYVTAKERRA